MMTDTLESINGHLAYASRAIRDVTPNTHGWQHQRLVQALGAITAAQDELAAEVVKRIEETQDK